MVQRKNSNRMDRVNEEIKKELSIIIDQDLKNKKTTDIISVTKVKTSSDLKIAKVYISLLNCKNKKETIDKLKSAAGYMRSEIAKRINLRYTPELRFEIDESMEYSSRIEEILNDLKTNKK